MSRPDGYQFCAGCGTELQKVVTPYRDGSGDSRVSLRCPKKGRFWDFLFGNGEHTDIFVDLVDTVLNFDPITGERIKRDQRVK